VDEPLIRLSMTVIRSNGMAIIVPLTIFHSTSKKDLAVKMKRLIYMQNISIFAGK
jgi:hypothetical protein